MPPRRRRGAGKRCERACRLEWTAWWLAYASCVPRAEKRIASCSSRATAARPRRNVGRSVAGRERPGARASRGEARLPPHPVGCRSRSARLRAWFVYLRPPPERVRLLLVRLELRARSLPNRAVDLQRWWTSLRARRIRVESRPTARRTPPIRVQSRSSRLRERLNRLQSRLASLRARLNPCQSRLASLQTRRIRMQSRLTRVRRGRVRVQRRLPSQRTPPNPHSIRLGKHAGAFRIDRIEIVGLTARCGPRAIPAGRLAADGGSVTRGVRPTATGRARCTRRWSGCRSGRGRRAQGPPRRRPR